MGRSGTTLGTNKKVVSEGSRFVVIAEDREEGFDQDAEIMIVKRPAGEEGTKDLDGMLLHHRVENEIITNDSGDFMQPEWHGTRPGRSVSKNDGRQELSKRLDRTIESGVHAGAEGTEGAKGRILPASIRGTLQHTGSKAQVGMKNGVKAGQKARNGDPRLKQNTMSNHLAPLLRDLEFAAASNAGRNLNDNIETDGSVSNVDWHPNLVFEQPSTSDMQD
ncbi:hypothetical protein V6N13_132108 [Hibiscus sabdariffa]